ncbi:MAG TPA: BtrH N-terminal domain-containing protein [Ruminiclostridium sp.]|nr:BtrH N-terminal domain-containing protein [Ruminiclostridium sp.]
MTVIDSFPVGTGKICLMSALTDILNFYKYGLRESDLFGLCEGNLFYFGGLKGKSQEELENVNLLRELNMGGMKYDIMQMVGVLQNVLGLSVEGYRVDGMAELKELVKSHVNGGIPLLALVLRYYLEYSVGYMEDNFSHTVTVYGYDMEQEKVYVTDTFVATKPVSNYKGPLSMENFLKAFNLEKAVFEMVTNERLLAIHPKCQKSFESVPVSLLNRSLVNTALNNLEQKRLTGDIYTGTQALKRFIKEFVQWNEAYSPEFFRRLLQTLHSMITNYGGPYVTCELLAEYIQAIYVRENRNIYREMAEELLELSRLWLIVGNMCFKASLGKAEDVCGRITERLKILLDKEEALYTRIVEGQNRLGVL